MMGDSIPNFYPNKIKFGINGIRKLLAGPIIFYTGPAPTPGKWIYQKCKHAGCSRMIGYWSLTGYPLLKDEFAKCEDHK